MHELSLMCPEDRVEDVSDALDALDALSVSVEDGRADRSRAGAVRRARHAAPKEGWNRSRVWPCSPRSAARGADLLLPQDFLKAARCWPMAVAEQDWVRLTQSQFEPVDITPEFWIVPTWHECPSRQGQHPSGPGPGLRHRHPPTTRMCLRWIARSRRTAWAARWTMAAARASWPLVPPSSARGDIDAVDIDPRPWNPPLNARPMRCS
jgi:ribosomal protein L11 methyltransferase